MLFKAYTATVHLRLLLFYLVGNIIHSSLQNLNIFMKFNVSLMNDSLGKTEYIWID